MARYCLTGSRMGTTYPRASPPVTTASLSIAFQAIPLTFYDNTDNNIQHRQLRLLLQQKSCLCCYCCYYISVVFQNTQAKNSSKNLKWQPAFRLVKVVFVVVNRQHRVHNQTVVPVVSVVVKTKVQKR